MPWRDTIRLILLAVLMAALGTAALKTLGRPTLVTRMRKPNATSVRLARPTGRKGRAESARRHAADLGPVIKAVQAAGVTSLRGIAKALNERGVPDRDRQREMGGHAGRTCAGKARAGIRELGQKRETPA